MENKELIENTIATLKTRVWDYLVSTESIRVYFEVEGIKDTLEHFSTVADKAALAVDYDSIELDGAETLENKRFGIFKVKSVEPFIL